MLLIHKFSTFLNLFCKRSAKSILHFTGMATESIRFKIDLISFDNDAIFTLLTQFWNTCHNTHLPVSIIFRSLFRTLLTAILI